MASWSQRLNDGLSRKLLEQLGVVGEELDDDALQGSVVLDAGVPLSEYFMAFW
jgi:hypothetical protein